MKKLLLQLYLLLFIINTALGQDEKIFNFGIEITPKKTYQIIENKNIGEGKDTYNYSFGLNMFYALSENIELKSGINYSRVLANQIDYTLTFNCDFNGVSADIYNSYTKEDYKIHYLGIPIEGKIKIIGNENHVYFKVGLESLFKFYDSHKTILFECGTIESEIENNSLKNLRKTIFKIRSGIGYERKFLKKGKIYFEPQFEYLLPGLFKEAGIFSDITNNIKTIDVGLIFGIKF